MFTRNCIATKIVFYNTQINNCTSNLQQNYRSFSSNFNYYHIANERDKGKSFAEIMKDTLVKKASEKDFDWDWIQWYERNMPETKSKINQIRTTYKKYENYARSGQGSGSSGDGSIDFESFRNKIADPTFVDELEIDYHVQKNTLSSVENMTTLNKWNRDAIKKFDEECNNYGDLVWPPMTDEEKKQSERMIEMAAKMDEETKDQHEELFKDYQQLDAEKMMLGQETFNMRFASDPQYAENMEDMTVSRQTYLEHTFLSFHSAYVKREKLAQIQDENRRKIFLERFEPVSNMIDGQDLGGPSH